MHILLVVIYYIILCYWLQCSTQQTNSINFCSSGFLHCNLVCYLHTPSP